MLRICIGIVVGMLLMSLFLLLKKKCGICVYGLLALAAMNLFVAAAYHLNLAICFDVVSQGMTILVYAFILGYIGVDLRMIYLQEQ